MSYAYDMMFGPREGDFYDLATIVSVVIIWQDVIITVNFPDFNVFARFGFGRWRRFQINRPKMLCHEATLNAKGQVF